MSTSVSGNPMAARVGRQVVANSLANGARKSKQGLVEVKVYVQENPGSLKVALLISAVLLAFFSILGLINIFSLFKPAVFLINFYNLIFALIIIVLEGKETWLGGLQRKIFEQAAFLSGPLGKGFFVLYVGTLIFCVDLESDDDFWRIVYSILGIIFIVLGVLQIQRHVCPFCCGGSGNNSSSSNTAGNATGGNNNTTIGSMVTDRLSYNNNAGHRPFHDEAGSVGPVGAPVSAPYPGLSNSGPPVRGSGPGGLGGGSQV